HRRLELVHAAQGDPGMTVVGARPSGTEEVETRGSRLRKGEKARWSVGEIAAMVVIAVAFLVVAFPVFYALLNSFRTYAEITIEPMGLPTEFRFENYVRLF